MRRGIVFDINSKKVRFMLTKQMCSTMNRDVIWLAIKHIYCELLIRTGSKNVIKGAGEDVPCTMNSDLKSVPPTNSA